MVGGTNEADAYLVAAGIYDDDAPHDDGNRATPVISAQPLDDDELSGIDFDSHDSNDLQPAADSTHDSVTTPSVRYEDFEQLRTEYGGDDAFDDDDTEELGPEDLEKTGEYRSGSQPEPSDDDSIPRDSGPDLEIHDADHDASADDEDEVRADDEDEVRADDEDEVREPDESDTADDNTDTDDDTADNDGNDGNDNDNADDDGVSSQEEEIEMLGTPVDSDTPEPASVSIPPERNSSISRRPLRSLIIAAILISSMSLMAVVPGQMLRRTRAAAEQCLNHVQSTRNGEASDCVPTSADLAPASWLFWLRGRVTTMQQDLHRKAALIDYVAATALAPDASARNDAAQALINANPTPDELAALRGAFLRLATLPTDADTRRLSGDAAKAIGNIDAWLTHLPRRSAKAHREERRHRGARLCYADHPDGKKELGSLVGMGALQDAVFPSFELFPPSTDDWSALTSIACEPSLAPRADLKAISSHMVPAIIAMSAIAGTPDATTKLRTLIKHRKATMDQQLRLRLAALVIAQEKPDAEDTLILLGPHARRAVDMRVFRTPWLLLGSDAPAQGVLAHVASADAAANHLLALIEHNEGHTNTFRQVALNLWVDAAVELLLRGRLYDAQRRISKAVAISPPNQRWALAPLLLAAGDPSRALQLTDGDLPHDGPVHLQVRRQTSRALALADLGRTREAHYAAAAAYRTSMGPQRQSVVADASLLLIEERLDSAWLWAATSFSAGRHKEVSRMLHEVQSPELYRLTQLMDLASESESQRRVARAEMSVRTAPASMLPAVMTVLAQLLPPEHDVEVWLDRVFHDDHLKQPLRSMMARAATARWRNDAAAAEQWQHRHLQLSKPMSDYSHALLGYLIGLR